MLSPDPCVSRGSIRVPLNPRIPASLFASWIIHVPKPVLISVKAAASWCYELAVMWLYRNQSCLSRDQPIPLSHTQRLEIAGISSFTVLFFNIYLYPSPLFLCCPSLTLTLFLLLVQVCFNIALLFVSSSGSQTNAVFSHIFEALLLFSLSASFSIPFY